MRHGLAVALVAVMSTIAAAQDLELEYEPVRKIETTETIDWEAPALAVKELVFYTQLPPHMPRQQKITSKLEPGGREGASHAPRRPLLFVREVYPEPKKGVKARFKVTHELTQYATHLVPGKPARAPALSADERAQNLIRTDSLDFESKEVAAWLDKDKLHRAAGERDLDFAHRVFRAMRKRFKYKTDCTESAAASYVCAHEGCVCGGLACTFVAALRKNDIPAHTLSLMMATPPIDVDEDKETVGHASSEFWADGIGWVPADVTWAICDANEESAERNFGNEEANAIVLAIDDVGPLATTDTTHFGARDRKDLPDSAFRSAFDVKVPDKAYGFWGFFQTGAGKLDGAVNTRHWEAKLLEDLRAKKGPAVDATLDAEGKPTIDHARTAAAFLVWRDAAGWHVRSSTDGSTHQFQIHVTPDGGDVASWKTLEDKSARPTAPKLALGYSRAGEHGIDFELAPSAKSVRFELEVDRQRDVRAIYVGAGSKHPQTFKFSVPVKTR